jgi:hypothetical protein
MDYVNDFKITLGMLLEIREIDVAGLTRNDKLKLKNGHVMLGL